MVLAVTRTPISGYLKVSNIFVSRSSPRWTKWNNKICLLALLRCLSLGWYDKANFEIRVLSRYTAWAAIVPLMWCIFSLCMRTDCTVVNVNQQKSQNGPLWNSSYWFLLGWDMLILDMSYFRSIAEYATRTTHAQYFWCHNDAIYLAKQYDFSTVSNAFLKSRKTPYM